MSNKIEELASTLLKNGIAFSKSQALEMAKGMSDTGDKVTKTFDERKEEVTMGSQYNSLPISQRPRHLQDAIKEMRDNAINSKPLNVNSDYEIPDLKKDATVKDIVEGNAVEEEKTVVEATETAAEKKEFHEAEKAASQVLNTGSAREEQHTSQDVSDMAESKIDLNQVFNFGKR